MAARSLNKVQLIGNLTRDPELRYTPAGTAVCTFGLATNRSWTTQSGETREETEFHRIVSWNKLAELCSQLLAKGRKVFVEGRLATHSWTGQDGAQRTTTEIVIEDMIILDSKRVSKENVSPAIDIPKTPETPKPSMKKEVEFVAEGDVLESQPSEGAKVEEDKASSSKPAADDAKSTKKKEKKDKTEEKSKSTEKNEEEEKGEKKENEGDENITSADIPF